MRLAPFRWMNAYRGAGAAAAMAWVRGGMDARGYTSLPGLVAPEPMDSIWGRTGPRPRVSSVRFQRLSVLSSPLPIECPSGRLRRRFADSMARLRRGGLRLRRRCRGYAALSRFARARPGPGQDGCGGVEERWGGCCAGGSRAPGSAPQEPALTKGRRERRGGPALADGCGTQYEPAATVPCGSWADGGTSGAYPSSGTRRISGRGSRGYWPRPRARCAPRW